MCSCYHAVVRDRWANLDAVAQAELVSSGEVHPRELIESAVARIERLNPTLNAVITPLFEQALAQADSPALPPGPFRGVPLLLKDYLCETAGDPYYEGLGVLRDLRWRAEADTYLAAKFRAAGFIVLGKTNLPALAGLPTSESAAFGPTRNPWDLTRSPGGSSSGSAAAVASGMVPVAHGNDGTGSLRIPAAACGLVGLKPSRGRVAFGPGRSPGLMGNIAEFVLVRSVRDAAAILDAVAGPMPGELWVAPRPSRAYRDEVGADPGRLRVGMLLHDAVLGRPVAPAVRAAVEQVGMVLQSLGHRVEESFPAALTGPTGLGPAYLGVLSASNTAAALDGWSARIGRVLGPDDVEPYVWARAEAGRRHTAVEVHAAVQRLMAGVCRAPEWWADGFDLLLSPTMAELPPRTESIDPMASEHLGEVFGLLTMPWSFTGQPAVSLPLGWSTEGLPIGIQIVAAYGGEDLLLRIAAQLEGACPWADRTPPIHVGAIQYRDE